MKKYYLLPFRFTTIAGHEVLVNEVGDMLTAPLGTVEQVVMRTIDTSSELSVDDAPYLTLLIFIVFVSVA